MTDHLVLFLRRYMPSERTERVQAWMVVIGVIGLFIAPFLATWVAVIVINMVSMITLITAGIAGVDSARNP